MSIMLYTYSISGTDKMWIDKLFTTTGSPITRYWQRRDTSKRFVDYRIIYIIRIICTYSSLYFPQLIICRLIVIYNTVFILFLIFCPNHQTLVFIFDEFGCAIFELNVFGRLEAFMRVYEIYIFLCCRRVARFRSRSSLRVGLLSEVMGGAGVF